MGTRYSCPLISKLKIMTKIKINVTKEILIASQMCGIDMGAVGSNCAVALAVREIFPKAWVEDEQILPFFGNDNGITNYDYAIALPKKVTLFIKTFDAATPEERTELNPFSFEVELSEIVIDKLAEGGKKF